ncbi:MAG: hypothetical protein K6G83_00215 [Lachnospiraceae bacterium]|nr:hypothetical protein [Lachnospiraceae bacterium]
MMVSVLMIGGAIIGSVGLIGIIFLIMEPFFRAIGIYFKRSEKYMYYETDRGRKLIHREFKALRNGFVLMLVVGWSCFGLGYYLKYMARGGDSLLFSEESEPVTAEPEAQFQDRETPGQDGALQESLSASGDPSLCTIRISGRDIYMDGVKLGDAGQLEACLKTFDRTRPILLTDDFAVAATWHRTEELLDTYGMQYEEE